MRYLGSSEGVVSRLQERVAILEVHILHTADPLGYCSHGICKRRKRHNKASKQLSQECNSYGFMYGLYSMRGIPNDLKSSLAERTQYVDVSHNRSLVNTCWSTSRKHFRTVAVHLCILLQGRQIYVDDTPVLVTGKSTADIEHKTNLALEEILSMG